MVHNLLAVFKFFQNFVLIMDCQSTNIIEIWKELATLSVNINNEIDNALQVSFCF